MAIAYRFFAGGLTVMGLFLMASGVEGIWDLHRSARPPFRPIETAAESRPVPARSSARRARHNHNQPLPISRSGPRPCDIAPLGAGNSSLSWSLSRPRPRSVHHDSSCRVFRSDGRVWLGARSATRVNCARRARMVRFRIAIGAIARGVG